MKWSKTEMWILNVISNITMSFFKVCRDYQTLQSSVLFISTWLKNQSHCHLLNKRAIDVQIRCFSAVICFSLGFFAPIWCIFHPFLALGINSITYYELIFVFIYLQPKAIVFFWVSFVAVIRWATDIHIIFHSSLWVSMIWIKPMLSSQYLLFLEYKVKYFIGRL